LSSVRHVLTAEVDELVDTDPLGNVFVGGAASADHCGSGPTGQLDRNGPDAACGTVDQDCLSGFDAGVDKQRLPGGQSGDRRRCGGGVVDAGWQRREVTGLDRDILSQGAIAGPVSQAEHSLTHAQTGGAIPKLGHNARHLVPRHARPAVPPGPVGPCCRPGKLTRGEPGRMHPHDHIVLCHVRVGQVRQAQPGQARVSVRNDDRLHNSPSPGDGAPGSGA
jgi:hypothetical protein